MVYAFYDRITKFGVEHFLDSPFQTNPTAIPSIFVAE
jgi:hypothetical protein